MKPRAGREDVKIERLFHEPGRLAIMTHLCGAARGLPFTELRELCAMTDGNLSRHLRVLEQAGAVQLHKAFVRGRPRTTVFASAGGRDEFLDYLRALEQVVRKAYEALPRRDRAHAPAGMNVWNEAYGVSWLGSREGRSKS